MSIDREEIADRLTIVGMSSDEAHLYLRLLEQGATKASELVEEVDVSRATVYRMLDRLANEGRVRRLPGEPTTYQAEDPGEVFSTEIAEAQTRREKLEEARDVVTDGLAKLGEPAAAEAAFFQQVEGFEQIANAARTLVVRAEERLVYADTRGLQAEEAGSTLGRELTDQAKAGLTVKALVTSGGRSELADDIEVRDLACEEDLVVVVADERDLLQVTSFEGRQAPRAIWTNEDGLTTSARLAFGRLWDRAGG